MIHRPLAFAELRRIFGRSIRPELVPLDSGVVFERPRLIVLVGQSGSGKTATVNALIRLMPGAVKVVDDNLRWYHPDYQHLMATDPLSMPEATTQAVGVWVKMSLEYLRGQRRDVVFESDLGRLDQTRRILGQFKAAGYDVEIQALAVPLEVSRLAILSRYVKQSELWGAGRCGVTPKSRTLCCFVPWLGRGGRMCLMDSRKRRVYTLMV